MPMLVLKVSFYKKQKSKKKYINNSGIMIAPSHTFQYCIVCTVDGNMATQLIHQ